MGTEKDFVKKLKKHKLKKIDETKDKSKHPPPLILLCVNATRVGTDTQAALQNHLNEPSIILVVLNHQPKRNVLQDPHSSSQVMHDNVLLVVDCFFFESEGFYDCNENQKALKCVAKAIKNYYKEKKRI